MPKQLSFEDRKMVSHSVSLDPPTLRRLREISKEQSASISFLTRRAIENYIVDYENSQVETEQLRREKELLDREQSNFMNDLNNIF